MRMLLKLISNIFLVFLLVLIIAFIYLNIAFPKVSKAPEIKVENTSEQIERGKYLANHVAVCMDCHSRRDWNYYAGPPIESSFGAGGEFFDEKGAGVPGELYSKNLTPAGLKDWSDGEIYHAITTGVTKSGNVIFPIMPWKSYGKMDPEDIKAIIAYLRSLNPIQSITPPSKLNFPLNIVSKTFPVEPEPTKRPAETDSLNYGKYLVTVAACGDCHTPVEKHEKIPGKEFAGGFEFQMGPIGLIRSANITPDNETGIGFWTEEQFVERFKHFDNPENKMIPYQKGKMQTIMPWIMYSGMKEGDLKSIYKYLRTIKPVKNQVIRFEAPKA